jgi:hypothetical protein
MEISILLLNQRKSKISLNFSSLYVHSNTNSMVISIYWLKANPGISGSGVIGDPAYSLSYSGLGYLRSPNVYTHD